MIKRFIDKNKEDKVVVNGVIYNTWYIREIIEGYTSNDCYYKDEKGNLIIEAENITTKIDKKDLYEVKMVTINSPLEYNACGYCTRFDGKNVELFNPNNSMYIKVGRESLIEVLSAMKGGNY